MPCLTTGQRPSRTSWNSRASPQRAARPWCGSATSAAPEGSPAATAFWWSTWRRHPIATPLRCPARSLPAPTSINSCRYWRIGICNRRCFKTASNIRPWWAGPCSPGRATSRRSTAGSPTCVEASMKRRSRPPAGAPRSETSARGSTSPAENRRSARACRSITRPRSSKAASTAGSRARTANASFSAASPGAGKPRRSFTARPRRRGPAFVSPEFTAAWSWAASMPTRS